MKRIFTITVVMLLFSAIFFVVVDAGADNGTKPWKGMWTGTLYVLGTCTDPAWSPPGGPVFGDPHQVINVAKGISTLAGESDFISSTCTVCTDFIIDGTNFVCVAFAGSGWGITTAANGDALYLEITSVTADLTTTPPQWTEHETVVGGTGRFEGMEGRETESSGTYIVTNPFPYGANISPQLLQQPQGWIGTSKGIE